MIRLATNNDLAYILSWLQQEYHDDSDNEYGPEGFWCNRNIIEKALSDDLWVLIVTGNAVAFQVGNYSPDILNVKKNFQGNGFGKQLFEASKRRCRADNINAMHVECKPRSSHSFWRKMGFLRYGNMTEYDDIKMALLLEKKLAINSKGQPVKVKVDFYSEEIIYQENVRPIKSCETIGYLEADNTIYLQKRIIGEQFSLPNGKDLAVQVFLNDVKKYLGKAKHSEAIDIGFYHDSRGAVFCIDKITNI